MRSASKIGASVVGLALVLGFGLAYALFHGYFDHGQFEIKQVQWSSAKQVAVVAERSDHEALSSNTYFVLIGDHVPSSSELRHRYHSSARVFAAADNCLDLRWQSPSALLISCNGHSLARWHIDVERHQVGGVAILYDNIPNE